MAPTTINLVSSLKGRSADEPSAPVNTLFVANVPAGSRAREVFSAVWSYDTGSGTSLLALDSSVTGENVNLVLGSYSPVVRSIIPMTSRRRVYEMGIRVVFNYYDIALEDDNYRDLVTMLY